LGRCESVRLQDQRREFVRAGAVEHHDRVGWHALSREACAVIQPPRARRTRVRPRGAASASVWSRAAAEGPWAAQRSRDPTEQERHLCR
jgi:hypothetical protein